MTSITNLIRGTDREDFDLFERSGANVERADEPLDEALAGFPDTWLTQDRTQQLGIAAEESRDLRLGRQSLLDQPIRMMRVGLFGDRFSCRNRDGYKYR